MNVTLDTNILVRAVVQDDKSQAEIAARMLRKAEMIAVPLSCLCEFVWVLTRVYRLPSDRVAKAIGNLLRSGNVVTDRPAVEAGLWFHEQGGDFADGVIEFEGRHMGATSFASFDQKAMRLMQQAGLSTTTPS